MKNEGSDREVDHAYISLISGTKAQFIKMMPIAWELERRWIPHRLIDTGQHESISTDLRREYGIRPPDIRLGDRYRNVNSVGRGIAWLGSNLLRYASQGARTRRVLFGNTRGIALVHGDTASTVLAAIIAKRGGQRVMHIEAGLRSWSWLNPFPEEMVRIAVMRMSDYLIAPSRRAYENLEAMSLRGRSWRVSGNTSLDVVRADLAGGNSKTRDASEPYCVVTIHRMETLYNRRRLELVVDSLVRAGTKLKVLFIQHAPTASRLEKYDLVDALRRAGVELTGLTDHSDFVHLLQGAEFIITDGGSVQEEASYLGVPCLVMRMTTERSDGLDENVVLSKMDAERIESFLDNYRQLRRPPVEFDRLWPSREIVDVLETLVSRDEQNA